jgi:hypothetical protein
VPGRSDGRCSSPDRSTCLPICPKKNEMHTMTRSGDRISVFLFALVLLALFVGVAFAVGYLVGRILL